MKYRAEIDGLRALAVIPVILFHAGFELFSGGFVGVDVFFVISGYLITTILIEDIENNRFSIVNFYERRARRIFPALFFVMLVCIPFAWIWMLPSQMKDFSQSLVAVNLFASNILFWRETGYFESAAEEKPLLHTWSLAIEEQYYMLFPIFFFSAWRFGKSRVFWMIVVMAVTSLLLSEWGWRYEATANFYLVPTRAWELFAGSITAFVVQKRGVQQNDALALLGLAAILFAIFAYNESTPFPSVYALVPVFGVVLLVLFADKKTLVARLLSTKAFVGIGLISYSAYLWHQPLFSFVRVLRFETPSVYVMFILSLASIILAFFSWRYIENPFRNKKHISRNQLFIFSIVVIASFISLGYLGHITEGFEERYSSNGSDLIHSAESSPIRLSCHFSKRDSSLQRDPCVYFNGTPSLAILGNSHGVELAYSLARKLKNYDIAVEHHTMSDCRHNFEKKDENHTICGKWHKKIVQRLKKSDVIDTVVLSYRNDTYVKNSSYRKSLVDTSEQLLDAGKKVVLVLQAPLSGADISKYIQISFRKNLKDVYGLTRNEWESSYASSNLLLDEIPKEVAIVNPADIFCMSGSCLTIKNHRALYFDNNHMSLSGTDLVSEVIIKSHLSHLLK